jgi:hypothetical protein
MNSNDELRELWQQQPATNVPQGEDMLTLVIERTRKLDRQIASRNTRECLVAAGVALFFAWVAWRVPDALGRAGWTIAAASMIWAAFYVLRFGAGPGSPDRSASVAAYAALLAENYDRQIRLLRTVKYWSLLPLWVGLAMGTAGGWLRLHAPVWVLVVELALITAPLVLVWALNEIWGVRYLERLKAQLPRND